MEFPKVRWVSLNQLFMFHFCIRLPARFRSVRRSRRSWPPWRGQLRSSGFARNLLFSQEMQYACGSNDFHCSVIPFLPNIPDWRWPLVTIFEMHFTDAYCKSLNAKSFIRRLRLRGHGQPHPCRWRGRISSRSPWSHEMIPFYSRPSEEHFGIPSVSVAFQRLHITKLLQRIGVPLIQSSRALLCVRERENTRFCPVCENMSNVHNLLCGAETVSCAVVYM